MPTTSDIESRSEDVLFDSIRQRRHVVLTHGGPGGWRTFKGEFVDGSPDGASIVVRLHNRSDAALLRGRSTAPLGCTFRLNHKKCMFGSTMQRVDDTADGAHVVLRWPDHLQQLQRRAYERSVPPAGTILAVRFWREAGDGRAAGTTRNVRHGQLEDISAGGLRIRVSNAEGVELDASYRCAFTPGSGKPSFLLEAICRHREAAAEGRASLGFQLVGMEATAEGRRALQRLARLVSRFQRGRIREHR
jgi:hypothetical protein